MGDAVSAAELLALAERCEASHGPNRELDNAIVAAVKAGCRHPWFINAPSFTGSLDAAMLLLPENALLSIVGPAGKTHSARVNDVIGIAITFPLALASGALRARSDQEQSQ